MNNYTLTNIHRMAGATGTVVTDRHLEILEFTLKHYDEHRVGPMFFALKRGVGADRDEIERLFPHGLNSIFTWVGVPIHTTDDTCKPPARIEVSTPRTVYLDNNATTRVRREVAERLREHFDGMLGFANPSSATGEGKHAYDIMETARRRIGTVLGVDPGTIIFTGSGTESNNLAVKGTAWEMFRRTGRKGHLITSSIEHASVLNTMNTLASFGFPVTFLEPDHFGTVAPTQLRESLRKDTILVALMAVNNEIGSINPVSEYGTICREAGVPLFVDAIQGCCKIPLSPAQWGITMLSLSGHKIYAPKGVAALYVDPSHGIAPVIDGGGQEHGLRSGTENVPYIDALGLAATLAYDEMTAEHSRLRDLQLHFLKELEKVVPDYVLNGPGLDEPGSHDTELPDLQGNRIHNNLSIGFPGVDSASLVLSLDLIGIGVSAGSACSSGKFKSSHVLQAIGTDTEHYGTVRFSFGRETTIEDLEYLFEYLPEILRQIRSS